MVFQGRKLNPTAVKAETSLAADLFLKWNMPGKKNGEKLLEAHRPELKWNPPAAKEMKINVDCSWCESSKAGSIAGVCRNNAGTLTHRFAKPTFAPSVWVAEALALREAVLWVRNRRLARTGEDSQLQETDLHVLISLDNLSLTNSLLGLEEPPWPGRPIVADCREILAQLNGVSIIYEPQDTNKAAD